jgi:hypothetical protein
MSGEFAHSSANPDPKFPVEADHVGVVTTPAQLLTGVPLENSQHEVVCTLCTSQQTEGMTVVVYAYRTADRQEWSIARCYCLECAPETLSTPTLGTSEVLGRGRLDVLSYSATQQHRLCLTDVSVVDVIPLTEGTFR